VGFHEAEKDTRLFPSFPVQSVKEVDHLFQASSYEPFVDIVKLYGWIAPVRDLPEKLGEVPAEADPL